MLARERDLKDLGQRESRRLGVALGLISRRRQRRESRLTLIGAVASYTGAGLASAWLAWRLGLHAPPALMVAWLSGGSLSWLVTLLAGRSLLQRRARSEARAALRLHGVVSKEAQARALEELAAAGARRGAADVQLSDELASCLSEAATLAEASAQQPALEHLVLAALKHAPSAPAVAAIERLIGSGETDGPWAPFVVAARARAAFRGRELLTPLDLLIDIESSGSVCATALKAAGLRAFELKMTQTALDHPAPALPEPDEGECVLVLVNDDYTPQEFVHELLMTLFGHSEHEAMGLMLEVDRGEHAEIARGERETLEAVRDDLEHLARARGYPLRALVGGAGR